MSDGSPGMAVDSVEHLASMDAAEVDALPYGFLILDKDGIILLYNQYESRMSRRPPESVIGRNWFREVAPCTRVEAFFGRFRKLIDDPARQADRFSFRFYFLHGAQDVVVQLSKVPDDSTRVFMTVVRRDLTGVEVSRPDRVTLDEDQGVLTGPSGVVLPLPAATVALLLGRVGAEEARGLGGDVGRAVVRAANDAAAALGEESFVGAPPLLRAGVLDAAVARAGLGRIAVDVTELESTGGIVIALQGASATVSSGLAAFYEGLIGVAMSIATGKTLVTRCLDRPNMDATPWLFLSVLEEKAHVLEEAGKLPPSQLLRAAGFHEAARTYDEEG